MIIDQLAISLSAAMVQAAVFLLRRNDRVDPVGRSRKLRPALFQQVAEVCAEGAGCGERDIAGPDTTPYRLDLGVAATPVRLVKETNNRIARLRAVAIGSIIDANVQLIEM